VHVGCWGAANPTLLENGVKVLFKSLHVIKKVAYFWDISFFGAGGSTSLIFNRF